MDAFLAITPSETVSPTPIPSILPYSNISGFCPDTLPYRAAWIVPLGQCVTNVRLYFAFFIGMASIVCWLVAQVPQLVLNCMHGKADEALSFWFLMQWFGGDVTNLVGALLTQQLPTQIVTAVYFVFIDTVILIQYLFYQLKNHGPKGLIECFKCRVESSASLALFPCLLLTIMLTTTSSSSHQVGLAANPMGRTLLSQPEPVVDVNDPKDVIGYILGCISAALYVGSRVPQIMKNFIRRSTEGLSLPMFVLAVLGNVTYGLGVFLVSVDPVFILRKLPWIIGSVGTLVFDVTIFFQFMMFNYCRKAFSKCYVQRGLEQNTETSPLLNSWDKETIKA